MSTLLWKSKTLQEYNQLHGPADEVTMQDSHGTLIMRPGGNEYRPLPGLVQKATNLAVALGEAAVAVVEGKGLLAPEAMITNRLAICRGDDTHSRCGYFDPQQFCRSCGCITAAKVRLASSRCPEGKWRSL